MLISELIGELERLRKEYGEIEVHAYSSSSHKDPKPVKGFFFIVSHSYVPPHKRNRDNPEEQSCLVIES